MNELGIYVHIPFCKLKCYYCDFISYCNKENLMNSYIDSLIKEIQERSKSLNNKKITTIYIGGGTPSIIDEELIKNVLESIYNNFDVVDDAEITIEVNPGTVTIEKLELYKSIGINRLSIGLQSTNNELLKQIGRIHTYEQFLETYKLARKVGFNNINVDLILALPNQKLKDLEESVNNIININPEHISVYSLIIEENTKLEQMINNNEVDLVDEKLERKMYWKVKKLLEKNNYKHYEISNFSKEGFESKHNMNCWNQEEYLGFGVAAHSYLDNKRFSNLETIEEYINNIQNNKYESNVTIHERQTKEEQQKEYMMLGLRKIEGISVQNFKAKFVDNPIFVFKDELEQLVNDELVEIDLDNIRLTKKGLDLANIVWEKFV